MKTYRIFTINPGSTSTKLALFENDKRVFSAEVQHDANRLREFKEVRDQLPFRMETIMSELEKAGVSLEGTDAFSARAGGLVGCSGGVYAINDRLYQDARNAFSRHANTLGPQIALDLQKRYGGQVFVVNPPDVDELDPRDRVTGLRELFRCSRGHALNQKENCIRYAAAVGKKYEDMELICCHLGGGVTVAAHHRGRMISVNDSLYGDGPMAPTRSGYVPPVDIIKLCYSGRFTEKEITERVMKYGGFTDLLGTADVREIRRRIAGGDRFAELVYNAFIYQVAKAVGGCAAVLEGRAQAIILTGGISHDDYLVENIRKMVGWIAPVVVQAGEFEMEALASGAIRAMEGLEPVLQYTGVPVWQGYEHWLSETAAK